MLSAFDINSAALQLRSQAPDPRARRGIRSFLHPVIFASTVTCYGRQQVALLNQFPHTHVLLALLREGFHALAAGGRVKLRPDGSALLDRPLTDFVMGGTRRALLVMMEIQFAAGARQVLSMHEMARPYTGWQGPGTRWRSCR